MVRLTEHCSRVMAKILGTRRAFVCERSPIVLSTTIWLVLDAADKSDKDPDDYRDHVGSDPFRPTHALRDGTLDSGSTPQPQLKLASASTSLK